MFSLVVLKSVAAPLAEILPRQAKFATRRAELLRPGGGDGVGLVGSETSPVGGEPISADDAGKAGEDDVDDRTDNPPSAVTAIVHSSNSHGESGEKQRQANQIATAA
jgi:hypothetical protein